MQRKKIHDLLTLGGVDFGAFYYLVAAHESCAFNTSSDCGGSRESSDTEWLHVPDCNAIGAHGCCRLTAVSIA